MARPAKKGISSFPVDVNIFSDVRIRKLIKFQGSRAIVVYMSLLCNIYKNGYYSLWNDDTLFTISDETGCELGFTREVIMSCLKIGLFDRDMFKTEKVLTSAGIQRRFLEVNRRRKLKIGKYNLIDKDAIPVESSLEECKEVATDISSVVQSDNTPDSPAFLNSETSEDIMPINECLALLASSKQWAGAICRKYRISRKQFDSYLQLFCDDCISKGNDRNSLKGTKFYVDQWLKNRSKMAQNDKQLKKTSSALLPIQDPMTNSKSTKSYAFSGGFGGKDV